MIFLQKEKNMHSETVEEIDQQIMQLELYLLLIGGRRLDVQHEIRMKLKELYAEKKDVLEEHKTQIVGKSR